MTITILGSGCANCKKLEANVHKAIKKAGIEATVNKITDMEEIMTYNILSTPGLLIDNELKSYGRVPSPKEIQTFF